MNDKELADNIIRLGFGGYDDSDGKYALEGGGVVDRLTTNEFVNDWRLVGYLLHALVKRQNEIRLSDCRYPLVMSIEHYNNPRLIIEHCVETFINLEQ